MRHVFTVSTGADEDQHFPKRWSTLLQQWATGMFKSPTQVHVACRWLTSAGWRQSGAAWDSSACYPGWTGGCDCQPMRLTARANLLSPLRQPGPERAHCPEATARQEDSHFQQNKPALSISTFFLKKHKCLPGVSPGQLLFVFRWVDSKDWSQPGSQREGNREMWDITG